MNVVIIAAVTVAIIVVMFGTDRVASHRNVARRAEMKDWDIWEQKEQTRRLRNLSLDHGDEISRLRRAGLIFAIGTAVVGTWAVSTMQDTADDTKNLADSTCQSTTSLLRLQSADLTNQIRQRQVRRDAAADEIILLQQTAAHRSEQPALSDVAGFDDLPQSVRDYVSALAESGATQVTTQDQQNIADARRRLSVYDEDLDRLRDQVDDIRNLTREIDKSCPDGG